MLLARREPAAGDLADRMIDGHTMLLAFWALEHAGVWDALGTASGIELPAFAEAAALDERVLQELLTYLGTVHGLVERAGNLYRLSAAGRGLETHRAAFAMVFAYQPMVGSLEHLLTRLKSLGATTQRRAETYGRALEDAYAATAIPLVADLLRQHEATHVLDLRAGTGALLAAAARVGRKMVGVGVCENAALATAAAERFANDGTARRLIGVAGEVKEIATDPARVLERMGVSATFQRSVDWIVGWEAFDALGDDAAVVSGLEKLRKAFGRAGILIVEPDVTRRAAPLLFLEGLSRATRRRVGDWERLVGEAGYRTERVKLRRKKGEVGACVAVIGRVQ